jgi:IS4 transposase
MGREGGERGRWDKRWEESVVRKMRLYLYLCLSHTCTHRERVVFLLIEAVLYLDVL